MRTTLDIADDVLLAVKDRARREHRTAGEVLSDLARHALTTRGRSDEVREPSAFHCFEPFPPRGRLVTNSQVDQLREEEGE